MVFSRGETVDDMNELLRRAGAADSAAEEEILRGFSVFIRAYARKFFLSEEDRQDLSQEGRIALFRAIRHYRPERGPFAPFARLVIRRHINRMAEKIIQVRAVENVWAAPEDASVTRNILEERNPETAVIEEERRKEISNRVRKHLTNLEWEVLSLFLEGMSYREMARRLRRPAKSVDNALRRIRTKVRV